MTVRILVYGDSNVWGDSGEGYRYDTIDQWPNIMQQILGDGYEVFSNGVCGRVAGDFRDDNQTRRGLDHFNTAIEVVRPLDLTVIALGVNDTKHRYGRTAKMIAKDLQEYTQRLVEFSQDETRGVRPNILYLGEVIRDSPGISNLIDISELTKAYDILQDSGAKLLVPENIERSGDNLHYSLKGHRQLAEVVGGVVRSIV